MMDDERFDRWMRKAADAGEHGDWQEAWSCSLHAARTAIDHMTGSRHLAAKWRDRATWAMQCFQVAEKKAR